MQDGSGHNEYECFNNISDSVIIVNDRWEVEFLNLHAQKEYTTSKHLKKLFDQLRSNSIINSFFSDSHQLLLDAKSTTISLEDFPVHQNVYVSILGGNLCFHLKASTVTNEQVMNDISLLEQLPVGVLIVDKQFHVRYSNAQAKELLHIDEADLGVHCRQSFCKGAHENCPFTTGKPTSTVESSSLLNTDKSRPLKRQTEPIMFEGEEMLLEVYTDISEKQNIQTELEAGKTSLKEHVESQNLLIKLSGLFKDFGNLGSHFDDFLRIIGQFFLLDRVRLNYKTEERIEEYSWSADGILGDTAFTPKPDGEHTFFILDANNQESDMKPSHHEGKAYISFHILNGCSVSGYFQIEKNVDAWTCSEILFFQSLQQLLENVFELVEVHIKLLATKELSEIANMAKSEFLANISHEIRTPLNAMLGYSQIILDNTSESESKYAARSIALNGNSLLDLLNDIIDLSKIEAGMLDTNLDFVSFSNFFERVQNLFIASAETKNLNFEIEYRTAVPQNVLIDATILKLILVNLIGNAFKFTKAGGVLVSVWSTHDGESVGDIFISVKDTGIGIRQESLNDIFEPFFQNEPVDRKSFSGVGLGLTIVNKLLPKIHASLSIQSTEGVGSEFTICIPNVLGMSSGEHPENLNEDILSFKNSGPEILLFSASNELSSILDDFFDAGHSITRSSAHKTVGNSLAENIDFLVVDKSAKDSSKVQEIMAYWRNNAVNAPICIELSDASMPSELFHGQFNRPLQRNQIYSELIRLLPELRQLHRYRSQKDCDALCCMIPQTISKEFQDELDVFVAPLLNSLSEGIVLNEAEQLSANLFRIGQEFDADCCTVLGQQLSDAVKAFDLFKIDGLLKDAEKLLHDINTSTVCS